MRWEGAIAGGILLGGGEGRGVVASLPTGGKRIVSSDEDSL